METKQELINKINKAKIIIREQKSIIKESEEKLILLSDTWYDKFKIWWENDEKCDHDWLPSKEECPLLRAQFEDMNRYQTYDLRDWFADEFYFIEDPDEYTQDELDKLRIDNKDLCLELMNNKVKSFTCDW